MTALFRPLAALAILVIASGAQLQSAQTYPFQDPALPIEQRIDNVLSLMTIDEKIASLSNAGVVVPRLGIQGTAIGESISGVVLGGPMQALIEALPGPPSPVKSVSTPTTQFPQGVGLARTWDPALIRKAGNVMGSEARYIFENGRNPKPFLVLLTPNADLARDPRWGRTPESYGEDPFFNGTIAAALIQGLQGDDPKYWQAASLVKHFLANSNEDGRYGSSSDLDERLLWEYYSEPFRMAFTEGGAKNFMASYNAWNHVPMTVNPILKDIAIRQWGVDGIISSDAGSLGNLVTQHKAYPNLKEAVAASIKAGINMFLTTVEDHKAAVQAAVADRLLTESDLDAVLRGSLRTAIRLGLLNAPDKKPYAQVKGAPDPVNSDEHNAISQQVARESVVLLKNSSNFLPLDRQRIHSIAVIGPRANEVLPDFYGGAPPYAVTPVAAIRAKVGSGIPVTYSADNNGDAAVKAAQSSDIAIVVVGNQPTCGRTPQQILQSLMGPRPCPVQSEGMESSDRRSLTLEQEDLVKAVYQANPRTVVVLVSSFPYAINWTQDHAPAILHMSHNSQDEGTAIADVLFGDYNPAGRLVQTWVKSLDQLPPMMDYNIRHGRTYMYLKGEPLYPFGYGLSYTSFKYSNLRTSTSTLQPNGEAVISVDVKNTGSRAGDEVVQLYVRHEGSKVDRPLKELKAFQRVPLQPDETKTVQMKLRADTLAYWDAGAKRFVIEAESISLMVGGSSADPKLAAAIKTVN